jgi:hypothetical protein
VHVEVWSPYKSRGCFLQPHLASGLLWRRGREESTGTPTPIVVETNVAQSAGSKTSLAEVGLMAPSHDMGFQKSSRALALSACSSKAFISTPRVESWTMACTIWGGEAGAAHRSACWRIADAGP